MSQNTAFDLRLVCCLSNKHFDIMATSGMQRGQAQISVRRDKRLCMINSNLCDSFTVSTSAGY